MIKTFPKGGIHPQDHKLSATSEVVPLALPEVVTLPVSQHIGVPATVIVKPGDVVRTGQVIAESAEFISASIHSPVSGVVVRTDDFVEPSGLRRTAVLIRREGDDWVEEVDRSPELVESFSMSPMEIRSRIARSGIVGLGGATFPAQVKLAFDPRKKVEVLIINAVECEPFLTCDHRLMLEKGPEILTGIRILMHALQVERAVVGIEENKPDAIAHLRALAAPGPGIQIQPLHMKYPQGSEKQLIKAITGREVPSMKLPIEVGAVVFNVATVFAVYEAVQKNKPLVDRVITVTGPEVARPGNFLVRIGTPISALIEAVGGMPRDTAKVIAGGPMMGKAVKRLDAPVTKGTSGLLLLPERLSYREEASPCVRCGRCVSVCVMGLEPYLLAALTNKQMFERAEGEGIVDCVECGSCQWTCPSHRPLLDFIRLGKVTVNKRIRARAAKI